MLLEIVDHLRPFPPFEVHDGFRAGRRSLTGARSDSNRRDDQDQVEGSRMSIPSVFSHGSCEVAKAWDKLVLLMLVHGFDMQRVYISGPGDLDTEKNLCRAVVSQLNEAEAMPAKILFVSVGLPNDALVESHRGAVADNIRQCTYFIQLFEDDWGPKNLMRKMFFLAYDARVDQSLPMREVLVFLKDAPRETDPEILAFRKELADLADVRVTTFKTADELSAALRGVLSGWVSQLKQDGAATTAAAGD